MVPPPIGSSLVVGAVVDVDDVPAVPAAVLEVVVPVVPDVLDVVVDPFADLDFRAGAVVDVVVEPVPDVGPSALWAAESALNAASMSVWYPARFCAFSAASAFW